MKAKHWFLLSFLSLLTISLAACGKNSSKPATNHVDLPSSYSAKGKAVSTENSTLKVAEVNDAPFKGISLAVLQDMVEDQDVYSPGGLETLFKANNNFKIVNGGLANQKLDRKKNTVTITLRKNARWSDGKPVIARDVEYAYEIIGNQNTTSSQYSSDFARIKGMTAYHNGKAKTISGITYPDGQNGKQVVIKYSKLAPSMEYLGNSFVWGSVVPYHKLKGIKISKLASSKPVRKDPVFTGPYKLAKQVDGESTSWVRNKYYYGPTPKIGKVQIQVVSTTNSLAAFKANKYDFALGSLPTSQYQNASKIKGYALTGRPSTSYSYFGFNLGHFDTKKNVNVADKNMKMGNKKLRQAMMYAINLDQMYKKLFNEVSWRANTLILPNFKQYYDKKNPGFPYNPKKANQLLDEAGYKKKGKWRVQPNGKPLTIYYGAAEGSSTLQAIYQQELQEWHKVGLNVKMATGKPMDINSFYTTISEPKQNKIDIFDAGWQVTSDPTPTQLYGADAAYNMGHFVSKKNTELINDINSDKAWNSSYRAKKFKEWQRYMNDEAAYTPDSYSFSFTPVNKRLKNYYSTNAVNYFVPSFWQNLAMTK